jgi:hypothetical protein
MEFVVPLHMPEESSSRLIGSALLAGVVAANWSQNPFLSGKEIIEGFLMT